jgi:hypothetical protein
MATYRQKIGKYYEDKAKSDLEERGYKTDNLNDKWTNHKGFDLIGERSNGSQIKIAVTFRKIKNWKLANGKVKTNVDGSHEGVEKIEAQLLPGGFTIAYITQENEDVYVIPHDEIKPLFPLWLENRNPGEHEFILNRKTANEINLDMESFKDAWHLLPPP